MFRRGIPYIAKARLSEVLVTRHLSKLKVLVVSLLVSTLLSACSWFTDRSGEYYQVELGEAVQVPEGLIADKISPLYPVPEIDNQRPLPVEYELPQPPDATAAIIIDPFEVETALGETWLKLFDSPSEVWPLLEYYWQEYAMDLVKKDTSRGFMATVKLNESSMRNYSLIDVLENSPLRPLIIGGMSFQVRVINGVRRNTSEVQVRVLLPNQDPEETPAWQLESINARLEKAMLTHIGEFVTSDAVARRHSFLANEIGGGSRVRLLDDAVEGQTLELKLSLPRAKNELEEALESAGVIVADNDLDNNRLYVSYLNEEELESWYHTQSMIERRRQQRNIEVRLVETESGEILIRADRLTEEVESDVPNTLLTIIFEHIS